MKLSTRERSGFTLIELLVVIAIIGVLASLTAAALFRLKGASQETRTNESLEKLHRAFEMQYKASIDSIRKEAIPKATLDWANNGDVDLAKVIHMKLRLRQEFPQSIEDLQIPSGNITGNAATDTALKTTYAPKTAYSKHLATLSSGSITDVNAALLMLVLSQSRGGAAFNPEQIGAGALGKRSIGGNDFAVFVDGFGTPINFAREHKGGNVGVNVELNDPTFGYTRTGAKSNDLTDPTGKLKSVSGATVANQLGIFTNPVGDHSLGLYRGPYIQSAGADLKYDTGDDLFSFRLQSTGKAN